MASYSKIDEVAASTQFGNTGPDGWGFHVWSEFIDDEAPHRPLLERVADEFPNAEINLPKYFEGEDYVEGGATWKNASVWLYYETILSYLWVWSTDRRAVESFRIVLMPFLGLP